MTPEERMQLIQQLYDKLPELTGCKGLCAGSCTDIDMSELERERIQRRHGIKIRSRSQVEVERTGPKRCKALGKDDRCKVYEDRPLICRAWGAIEAAPCPWGCSPKELLSDEEYKLLQLAVESLGGHYMRSEKDRWDSLQLLRTPAGKWALKRQMDKARAEVARMKGEADASTSRADL